MFTKVLVTEDFDGFNVAVKEALKLLEIPNVAHVSYCDDALTKLKKGLQDGEPYDLLITDLSFKPDHRKTTLGSGQELIVAAQELQPSLRVIVFSIESRPHPIQHLFEELGIDGYVLKGRNNIPEIRKAVTTVCSGMRYLSPEISHVLTDKSLEEIDEYDRSLMRLLAEGMSQADIADTFQQRQLSPNSVSSIEKRINRLKIMLRANNNVQLIAIAKDLGLV